MLSKRLRLPIQQYVGLNAPRPQRVIRGDFFSIRIYASTLPYARIGVVVGKSVDKRAVVRNRIRRTIMDVAQLKMATLHIADYVVMVNRGASTASREMLKTNIAKLFSSLF